MVHKSKVLTFILSWLPGLGHLYLGLNKRGLQFMVAAFTCIVLIPILPPVFPFVLAIIWFYSVFDALQKATVINTYVMLQKNTDTVNHQTTATDPLAAELDRSVVTIHALQGKNSSVVWLGVLCILIGLLVFMRKIFPSLWLMLVSVQAGSYLFAIVLIGFGVWLIQTRRRHEK